MIMNVPDLPDASPLCTCDKCQDLCRHPCWPTPDEAQRLIDAGYGAELMLEWRERGGAPGVYTRMLCPALPGHEGFYAPEPTEQDDWAFYGESKRCIMQTPDGLCRLHALELKPLEGRLASGCQPYRGVPVRRAIAQLWATPRGQDVVSQWRQRFAKG